MKRTIYLGLAAILGILLGVNAAFLTEQWLIEKALAQDQFPQNSFFLSAQGHASPYFWLLTALGALAGWFLGRRWWKAVYGKKSR